MKPEIIESRADTRLGRRAVLGAGFGGAAISLLPLLVGKGDASSINHSPTSAFDPGTPGTSGGSGVPDTAGSGGAAGVTGGPSTSVSSGASGPTTTSPPRRPTDADIGLLGMAQQAELTARALYDAALAAGDWSDVETSVLTTIREAHEAAAQSLAGMLGNDAPGEMSQSLFVITEGGFKGSNSSILEAAYNLESALVATYHDLLAQLVGTDGATLIAAVQSAEARHGVVLADLNGQTVISTLLVETEAAPLVVTA